VISDTELKQVVYAFKCNNSTLQVKGKINSIILGLYTLQQFLYHYTVRSRLLTLDNAHMNKHFY